MEAGRPALDQNWSIFWSETGLRVGSEKWEDGNTANGDGNRGPDEETSDIL